MYTYNTCCFEQIIEWLIVLTCARTVVLFFQSFTSIEGIPDNNSESSLGVNALMYLLGMTCMEILNS